MVKISISSESCDSIDFVLSEESLGMISRFLHYIGYCNGSLYDNPEELLSAVSVFFNCDYPDSCYRDAKFLKCALDYSLGKLV